MHSLQSPGRVLKRQKEMVLQPVTFQVEFLVQHTEELWDGEVAASAKPIGRCEALWVL